MKPGVYLGQCAQFCGVEHAKMLLRVYVDTPEQFAAWIAAQQQAQAELRGARSADCEPGGPSQCAERARNCSTRGCGCTDGSVFEQQACINCHTVAGTVANGRFGPDLTHLMSRDTLAAGAMPNTPENLKAWIADPNDFKPGCLMPAMHLTDAERADHGLSAHAALVALSRRESNDGDSEHSSPGGIEAALDQTRTRSRREARSLSRSIAGWSPSTTRSSASSTSVMR